MKLAVSFILIHIFLSSNVMADNQSYKSKYTGQEKRRIKSLSADDIEQLKTGKGWGLAKAAELNGMPGPSHVLQMKDKIELTAEQREKIQILFNEMKRNAIPLGEKLVKLESELNDDFANRAITQRSLKEKLAEIEAVRSQLRFVHLVTHLQTPDILTPKQVSLYNRLRGYSNDDPCSSIPTGHDAAMWKKHNGCK